MSAGPCSLQTLGGGDPSLPLPSFRWWLPGVLDVPWLVDTPHHSLPLLSRRVLSVRPPVCSPGLLIRTRIIGLGPALISFDLIVTDYVRKDPISK